MSRIPSQKFLLLLILFSVSAFFFSNYISWADMLDQAKEYHFKADKLQNEGKLDQAIVYYQKAIGLDKYCLPAYNGLAICYEKKKLFSRAEEWYLKVLEVDPQYAPVHYNLGLFYEKYGDIRKAIFHWKQRIRLGHPGSPGTIKARAKLRKYASDQLQEQDATELEQQMVDQKVKGALDKILGRNRYGTKEDRLQDYYLEGMQYYQEGDYRQAAECFNKMIETLPLSN